MSITLTYDGDTITLPDWEYGKTDNTDIPHLLHRGNDGVLVRYSDANWNGWYDRTITAKVWICSDTFSSWDTVVSFLATSMGELITFNDGTANTTVYMDVDNCELLRHHYHLTFTLHDVLEPD